MCTLDASFKLQSEFTGLQWKERCADFNFHERRRSDCVPWTSTFANGGGRIANSFRFRCFCVSFVPSGPRVVVDVYKKKKKNEEKKSMKFSVFIGIFFFFLFFLRWIYLIKDNVKILLGVVWSWLLKINLLIQMALPFTWPISKEREDKYLHYF